MTQSKIRFSDRALLDLERLTDFLMESDPAVAIETVPLILDAIAILAIHPAIGRRVNPDEIPRGAQAAQLRELVISRGRAGYVALYSVERLEDRILIHAIKHQREAGYPDQLDP